MNWNISRWWTFDYVKITFRSAYWVGIKFGNVHILGLSIRRFSKRSNRIWKKLQLIGPIGKVLFIWQKGVIFYKCSDYVIKRTTTSYERSFYDFKF